jgi:hypothetical protein
MDQIADVSSENDNKLWRWILNRDAAYFNLGLGNVHKILESRESPMFRGSIKCSASSSTRGVFTLCHSNRRLKGRKRKVVINITIPRCDCSCSRITNSDEYRNYIC